MTIFLIITIILFLLGGPEFGEPNISRFFPSPATTFHSFFRLLGVFSWNYGGVFVSSGPSNVHVWSSRAVGEKLAGGEAVEKKRKRKK